MINNTYEQQVKPQAEGTITGFDGFVCLIFLNIANCSRIQRT
jgi:hypothetical protein